MIYNIYSFKDTKIGFLNPWVMINDDVAIRTFKEAAKDERSDISRHPEDIELWAIGQWDNILGKIDFDQRYIINGIDIGGKK